MNTQISIYMKTIKNKTMKKTSLSLLATTVLALLFSVSCSDNFLDTEPVGKASVEQFYETDEDANQAIIAVYDVLQWINARDWDSHYMVKTLPGDLVNAGGANDSDQPPYQRLNNFTFSSENDAISATYSGLYYGIYRTNMVIHNTEPETELRERIIAEAKFFRAYFYFELVTMFGDVPLNLKALSPSEYSQPRTPAADVYTQIEEDLSDAISGLPFKSAYDARDKFRPSKGTARALLGKAHLYQEEYNSAHQEFAEVISSGEFSLVPEEDYMQIFRKEQEFGEESLLEISYTTGEGNNWGNFQWAGSRAMDNNIHWQLAGPRNLSDGGNSGMVAGWGFLYPTEESFDAYAAADTVRRHANVWSQAEIEAMGGSVSEDQYQYEGYLRVKYGTFLSETSSTDGDIAGLNFGTNIRLIRYADVLLMAAEAYLQDGQPGNALTEFNKVRRRAGMPELNSLTMDDIVHERKVELAFEGHRYMDLVRWERAAEELGDRGFQSNKHELFPIPADEMRSNDQINSNNPGY